jgi:hypothetical protein
MSVYKQAESDHCQLVDLKSFRVVHKVYRDGPGRQTSRTCDPRPPLQIVIGYGRSLPIDVSGDVVDSCL